MKNNYAIILSILTVVILIALKVFNNIQKKNNNKPFYNISFNEGIELNQIEIISSKKIDDPYFEGILLNYFPKKL